MRRPNSARLALRSATATHHERVDAAFRRYDLSDLSQYKDFLQAQAFGFLPVEAAIDGSDIAALLPDWPDRRRSRLLTEDLAALGVSKPAQSEPLTFETREAALGALYVLEGSRLGGGVLARSIPAHFPLRFLGASDSKGWRRLIELLDVFLVSECQRAAAIDAACRVFTLFEGGARRRAS